MSNTLQKAAELLPQFLNDAEVLNGEGSLAFTKQDRTTARIFLRQGNVYAVDNLDYEGRMWSELKFEEHITHGNLRALIRAHKSQRDSLYKLLKRTRTKMKNDENLILTLQEYTLGAIDDIYSWENVKAEWRLGDTFEYDAADVPEFPLTHMVTLCVNRSLFKLDKYAEWGFKNDDQFLYGNVYLEGDLENLETTSILEQTIVLAGKFVIKSLVENTGFSYFTVASALDDLSRRVTLHIENPSGRQTPVSVPLIPSEVPVVRNKLYFSATDEDPDMEKIFNSEYHVPVPALLDDEEDEVETLAEDDGKYESFDELINDTTSLEVVNMPLPPRKAEPAPVTAETASLSKEVLAREESADDIAELYRSLREVPKSRGAVKKPVLAPKASPAPVAEKKTEPVIENPAEGESSMTSNEDTTAPTTESERMNMSESPLIVLLEQLKSQLSEQQHRITQHSRAITEKEQLLEAAKDTVDQLTAELANEIGAKEAANADYEKALKILRSING